MRDYRTVQVLLNPTDEFFYVLRGLTPCFFELKSESALHNEEQEAFELAQRLRSLNKKIILNSNNLDLVQGIHPDLIRFENSYLLSYQDQLDDLLDYAQEQQIPIIYEVHKCGDNDLAVAMSWQANYSNLYIEYFYKEFSIQDHAGLLNPELKKKIYKKYPDFSRVWFRDRVIPQYQTSCCHLAATLSFRGLVWKNENSPSKIDLNFLAEKGLFK